MHRKCTMKNNQKLLANMYTFRVTAHVMSFTKAAKVLFLTQGAVSHRIKSLEKELGFDLFIRLTRQLKLTPEGERLLLTLGHSLDMIFSELEDIAKQELNGELCIGTSSYFASAWLIPRLPDFQALYPNLNIKIQTREEFRDFQYSVLDAGIYYSEGNYPDCYSQRLFDDYRVPVCTPEYANKFHLYDDIDNLTSVNFIHGTGHHAWEHWLSANNVNINCTKNQYLFTHNNLTIDAAKSGLGISMGRLAFVKEDLESGELVAPFPSIKADKGYDIVCTQGLQKRAKFLAFSKWVLSECEK